MTISTREEKTIDRILFSFRLPKKILEARTIKRKADCCLLLGSTERAYQEYRRAAEALKSQNDSLWSGGSLKNLTFSFSLRFRRCRSSSRSRRSCCSELRFCAKAKTSITKNIFIFNSKFIDEK